MGAGLRPTLWARILTAAAGGLLLAGALSLTLAPSALGLAMTVYLLHTRQAAKAAIASSRIRLRRQVLEDLAIEGRPVHVLLDTQPSRLAPGLRAEVRDLPIDGQGDCPWVEVGKSDTYAWTLPERGRMHLGPVAVRYTDRRGLWRASERLHAPHEFQVYPDPDAAVGASRRQTIDVSTPDTRGISFEELEFESLKPFGAGDRFRDIDWKRLAQERGLLSKEWEKQNEASVLLLVDAGRSMQAGDGSKLRHSLDLCLEITDLAAQQSYGVGFVAFEENRALQWVPTRKGRGVRSRIRQAITDLPPRLRLARRPEIVLPRGVRSEADKAFLAQLAELRGASDQALAGLEEAIELVTRQREESLFVYLMTDLERLPQEVLTALRAMQRRGGQVRVVVLPGSRYLSKPTEPRLYDLEAAYREQETRKQSRSWLRAQKMHVTEVAPGDNSRRLTTRRRR